MGYIKNVQVGDIYLRGGVYHLVLEKVCNIEDMYWCSVNGGELDIDSLIQAEDYAGVHITENCQFIDKVSETQHKEALANLRQSRLEKLQSLRQYQEEHKDDENKPNKAKKLLHSLTSGVIKIGKI